MPPGMLVSYTVRVAPVVDFGQGYAADKWSALWEEFHCDWRALWFNERIEPPSWVLADEVLAAGAKGILFASSLAPGGVNLVLFNEMLSEDDFLQIYDPAGVLSTDRSAGHGPSDTGDV